MRRYAKKENKVINKYIFIFCIVLLITLACILMMKYYVEGETNMPFQLTKIMQISTAEGVQNEGSEHKWDLNIMQNNDIYINIEKNKNYKEKEVIDKIIIDNFSINQEPQTGAIKIYKPTSSENKTYEYSAENEIIDKLEYIGNTESNIKELKVANQGGLILLRFTNNTGLQYISDEDVEIRHDGTLLSKANVSLEEIKYKISFDITMQMISEKSYKATFNLDLPIGNIIEEGTASHEKTNFKDIIFKRI